MEKILTELLVELLDSLSIDQKNQEVVEIDFTEEIKKLIIDKLDKIPQSNKLDQLKDNVVHRSWGTYIIGIKWMANVKVPYLITGVEGCWPIVSIKYDGKVAIKPLEIQKYLNNTQYGDIFLY